MSLFDSFPIDLTQLRTLISVFVAMVLGAIVGIEREAAHKPAGLRTHMFVAGVSALLVNLSDAMLTYFSLREGSAVINADPVRIIEAIITGISFIGAGTIIQSRREQSVEGLTTAASILFVAGIGVAVALHQYVLAVGGTFLALVSLVMVKWISQKITNQGPS